MTKESPHRNTWWLWRRLWLHWAPPNAIKTRRKNVLAKRDVTLDRRPFDAILVRQIVIATLFRFAVNVKFYFFMS